MARDLIWAVGVAALLAASPTTGAARLGPSLLLGALGGGIVFALRRRRPEPPVPRPPALAEPPAGLWAVVVAFAIAFAPTLVWLWSEYTHSIWRNAHGLFVPPVMLLLARSVLRRDARGAAESSPWGFAFLLPALVLLVADAGVRSGYLSAFALILALPGLCLLFLGARRTRALALPLSLGIFLLPIPRSLEDPMGLPSATAALMEPMLTALGVPALRHQTQFQLSDGWLAVSQNCSGLATLYAAAALGVLLAFTTRSVWRRAALLVLPAVLTLLMNAVRGVGLAILCERYGVGILEHPLHGLSGLAVFWTVVAVLYLVGDRRGLREAFA